MRYVIQTAISHGHIKQQITTVGSHGCTINTKRPESVDTICSRPRGFPAGALEARVCRMSSFRAPTEKTE